MLISDTIHIGYTTQTSKQRVMCGKENVIVNPFEAEPQSGTLVSLSRRACVSKSPVTQFDIYTNGGKLRETIIHTIVPTHTRAT